MNHQTPDIRRLDRIESIQTQQRTSGRRVIDTDQLQRRDNGFIWTLSRLGPRPATWIYRTGCETRLCAAGQGCGEWISWTITQGKHVVNRKLDTTAESKT